MSQEFINPYTGSKLFGTEKNIIPYLIDEIFVTKTYDIGSLLNGTVLDLGANIGVAADFFRDAGASRIFCIEPVDENFNCLQRYIIENDYINTVAHRFIIWSSDNASLTSEAGKDYTNGSFYRSSGHSNSTTPSITLSSLFKLLNLDRVDLVKMDIEGSEVEVMQSEDFKKVVNKSPNWLIEIHNHQYDNLVPIMRRAGFDHKVLSGFDLVNPVVHFYGQ